MPYIILTSQAKLVNTYVCGPIVVGDKGADPKLMKAVGAKLVTNYPACGSPPLYLVYGNPRTVLDKFESAGYNLLSTAVAGESRECILWTLYSDGGFSDPNSKSSQTDKLQKNGNQSPKTSIDRKRSEIESSSKSREQIDELQPVEE